MLNWRLIYWSTIPLRFVLALSNSYIHPDEHFQNFEVLGHRILGYSTVIPWEFSSDAPARSLGPLYLIYGPILYTIRALNLHFTPLQILYLVRLQFVILGWIITDCCLWRLLPTKPERIKALFFTLTSYVTLVYQSHCFSNSVETWLVLGSLVIIDDLRNIMEIKLGEKPHPATSLFYLGTIFALGLFNRVTFPAFIILPSYFLAKYIWMRKSSIFPLAAGFVLLSLAMVIVDTFLYRTLDQLSPLEWRSFVITPLNNILYNSQLENLAKHGLHPRYTHFLVNIPQMLGPGLIFLFYKFKNLYWQTIPFLSAFGGCVILSIIPHQELRFLLPLVPLLCSCFDVTRFSSPKKTDQSSNQTNNQSSSASDQPRSKAFSALIYLWYGFNIVLAVLMGVYHQGGVIPALDHIGEQFRDSDTPILLIYKEEPTIQIWWRTYSPPVWMLGDTHNKTKISLLDEKYEITGTSRQIIDAMGSEKQKIVEFAKKHPLKKLLICPIASYNLELKDILSSKLIWQYHYHLDLDHLDIENLQSFQPGIGIYELI